MLVIAATAACTGSEAETRSPPPSVASASVGATTAPTTTTATTPMPVATTARPEPSALEAAQARPQTEGHRRLVAVGVPDLAARAYLNASVRAGEALPGCRVPAEVLAAVGAAESRHGTITEFDERGTTRQVLRGFAATGDDTDEGRLDQDTEKDWAVGPMQFIPSTWTDAGRDGDGDGVSDPSNFFDAAMATAAYLCALAGPFPDATFIAGQWNQHDQRVKVLQQRADQVHAEWQRLTDQRRALEEQAAAAPGDTTVERDLAELPDPGPEPTFEAPPEPAGPAQFLRAVRGYYGPEGDARDDYEQAVVQAFRTLTARTGGTPIAAEDRVVPL